MRTNIDVKDVKTGLAKLRDWAKNIVGTRGTCEWSLSGVLVQMPRDEYCIVYNNKIVARFDRRHLNINSLAPIKLSSTLLNVLASGMKDVSVTKIKAVDKRTHIDYVVRVGSVNYTLRESHFGIKVGVSYDETGKRTEHVEIVGRRPVLKSKHFVEPTHSAYCTWDAFEEYLNIAEIFGLDTALWYLDSTSQNIEILRQYVNQSNDYLFFTSSSSSLASSARVFRSAKSFDDSFFEIPTDIRIVVLALTYPSRVRSYVNARSSIDRRHLLESMRKDFFKNYMFAEFCLVGEPYWMELFTYG